MPYHWPKGKSVLNWGVKIDYILNITLDIFSGSDLHKHQSATHILISYSDIHISTSD